MAESTSRQRLTSKSHEVRRQSIDPTKNLPVTVLLSMLEWLAVPDLLEVGKLDSSFQDLTAKELPWKAAARHLWKSALLDGQQSLSVEAAGVHENARSGEFFGACGRKKRKDGRRCGGAMFHLSYLYIT